ncbi:serine/threonine-protein kinase [Larkinella rosea]|uniref:Serine/threonine protein kinase n=1 Tax=Larkinella rosea TaxID=2025312 RepID=A0A3P1BTI9_9BACT|nr:serine/threonine-protein kinase [Larkinella rosea]RRB04421.1 serine/threonine protein kinase [Larkinella rosea]
MTPTFTSFQEFKRRYPIRPTDQGAQLGSGSYGRVIKVEDQLETEWVAIKVSEFKGNDAKSLRAEVELAQRVPRQANIARYDACYRLETDTSISDFAIMKYYPDGNLADLLKRETVTPGQLYEITRGILLGLQHLHRHRIVHRDFKPANILISRDHAGRFIPKIADFGLSKLVSDDELDSSDFDLSDGRGTPSYKAPEQIEGSKVSFNLDLWAFGIILYEMLTGEKPFRADLKNTSEQSARREIEKKIVTVELPAQLNQVNEPYQTMIRRCLVRDIHERVRKEDELLDLLDRIPQLLDEAQKLMDSRQFSQAVLLYEQVLAKREHHAEAEQGAAQCRAVLEERDIHSLLAEADDQLGQLAFGLAKNRYEKVLQLDPTQERAIQGLALCVEQLRPKPVVAESELTDAYLEERTDVYEAPSVLIAPKKAKKPASMVEATPVQTIPEPVLQTQIFAETAVLPAIVESEKWIFPWRRALPVAIGLGGIALFFYFKNPADLPKGTLNPGDSPAVLTKPEVGTAALPLKPQPGETKDALTKRIDIALYKARNAYREKGFETAVMLTSSALLLDPTRRDVAALRTAALAEIQKTKPVADSAVVPEPTKENLLGASNETAKPDEPAVNPKETLLKEKQEQYDQLVEEGINAIKNGNNKVKAVASFSKAQGLAKEHGLVTAKAETAYNSYMSKANKIFATDEFEGAKGWYLVAQALKDTEEVRRKIKLCAN